MPFQVNWKGILLIGEIDYWIGIEKVAKRPEVSGDSLEDKE